MEYRRHFVESPLRHYISTPFIYMMIVPIVILDVFFEVYQRICFPLYNLPLRKRGEYIRIDRQKLSYLTLVEKVHCMYCGYANGVLHYASTIAADTERYWCGIKHKQGGDFQPPEHHKDFLPYGDEAAFRDFVNQPAEESEACKLAQK